jgi:hypothetical protein
MIQQKAEEIHEKKVIQEQMMEIPMADDQEDEDEIVNVQANYYNQVVYYRDEYGNVISSLVVENPYFLQQMNHGFQQNIEIPMVNCYGPAPVQFNCDPYNNKEEVYPFPLNMNPMMMLKDNSMMMHNQGQYAIVPSEYLQNEHLSAEEMNFSV